MSETKHTPGPWRVTAKYANAIDCADVWTDDPPGSVMIAECRGPDKAINAHFIAAAPEMYAALKELLCWFGPGTAEMHGAKCETLNEAEQQARAVLAKAEGRE